MSDCQGWHKYNIYNNVVFLYSHCIQLFGNISVNITYVVDPKNITLKIVSQNFDLSTSIYNIQLTRIQKYFYDYLKAWLHCW